MFFMKKFKSKTDQLLGRYSRVMKEMRVHGIIRSNNNPVGDLGEVIACEWFDLERELQGTRGFDAKDKQGKRYQIKSRRTTPKNKKVQLSASRNINNGKSSFDFLVFIMFDQDFVLQKIGKMPVKIVKEHGKYDRRTNSWRLNLTRKFLSCKEVVIEIREGAEYETDKDIDKVREDIKDRIPSLRNC